ncbi:MAG: hypothetical protein ACKO37_03115 [Vampirovibrionales bacterium]
MKFFHFGTFLAACTTLVILTQGFVLHSPLWLMTLKSLGFGWVMLWLGGLIQQRFDMAWLQWQVEQKLAKASSPSETDDTPQHTLPVIPSDASSTPDHTTSRKEVTETTHATGFNPQFLDPS